MTTEEQLWNRFVEIEGEIAQLKNIVQNTLPKGSINRFEAEAWLNQCSEPIAKLFNLSRETYNYLKASNDKDI